MFHERARDVAHRYVECWAFTGPDEVREHSEKCECLTGEIVALLHEITNDTPRDHE